MTQTIQNAIIICHLNDTLNEKTNTLIINTLLSFKNSYEAGRVKGIYISAKHFSHFLKSPFLEKFIQDLDQTAQSLEYPIALGDYSKQTYETLKKYTENTQIKLFQDIRTATLFLNPKALQKELRILLFDEEDENAQKLSVELVSNGHSVTYAHTLEDFKAKVASQSFDMTIMQNRLNLKKSTIAPKQTLALSKTLVMNLPIFIDTAVSSLVTITGLEASKVKHEIRPFATLNQNVVVASMHFKGEISGTFFLIFPKEIALKALSSMIGEEIDNNDTKAIMDGIGEFCNIITGGVKAIFSNKKLKVLFELPKTYLTASHAINEASTSNGLWIEMVLDDKPFYMFITA